MKSYLSFVAHPTLELGRKEAEPSASDKVGKRYKRVSQQKHKRENSDAESSLLSDIGQMINRENMFRQT